MDGLFKELNVKLINVFNRACPFIKKYSRNILNKLFANCLFVVELQS